MGWGLLATWDLAREASEGGSQRGRLVERREAPKDSQSSLITLFAPSSQNRLSLHFAPSLLMESTEPVATPASPTADSPPTHHLDEQRAVDEFVDEFEAEGTLYLA